MDLQSLILLIVIGLSAGFISGLLGIGGGIIVIPALIFIMGLNQSTAQGTNLAMMIPPIGILAAMNYYKQGYVNVKYAAVLALLFIIGGYFGSKLAIHIPKAILQKIFAVMLVALAIKMFFNK